MARRDWKKQLKRVRDIADKNFARGEKPEQLDETLTKLEQRIENIKQVCQAVGKKLLACLQLHGVDSEKRLKKLPDSALSKQLQESSCIFDDSDAFRRTLSLCSRAEELLANQIINYENDIEKLVLEPLQLLIEKDIPAIVKSRKLVLKQAQEVETLRSRHAAGSRQSMLPQEGTKRLAQMQDDLEDAVNKLELYKDQLATEMYSFCAKEADLNKIFIRLIESQIKYHSTATSVLEGILPEMKLVADEGVHLPVFGIALEDHLRHTKQPLALVLSECIDALQKDGMQLEGLFRVAGGATKLKKLRAAFDAGMVEMDEYMIDPHCVASVLKLYLRELPEPLMTFELFSDWSEAAQCSGEQRVNAIKNTLKKMRKPHLDNLQLLVQFLARLAYHSEVNKMSASNLAIVIGPNLLWSQGGDGQNILATGVQSAIAETLISNCAVFFGEDPHDAKAKTESLASVSQNSASQKPSVANDNRNSSCCGGEQFSGTENVVMRSSARSEASKSSNPPNTAVQLRSKGASSSTARRFQAQRDFLCRRVDSVLARSWPERPIARNWHDTVPSQNPGTAIHESFRTSRPVMSSTCLIPRHGHSSNSRDFRIFSKVEAPRPTPPKSVHSEMYSTAFALQSLGDVDCADYLAKVRTLWDSHMEVSRKRMSTVDMSRSCHAEHVPIVTSHRQLSLSEGHGDLSHILLPQPNVAFSDPNFSSETASILTSSSASSRDASTSGVAKLPMRRVDSSGSLSSDSLGMDSSITTTNASSISSSDFSTPARNIDAGDTTNPVPPKRGPKKTHAPLPPATELTTNFATANATATLTRTTLATSGEHVDTSASNKTKTAAGNIEPSDSQILLHASKANVVMDQPKGIVRTSVLTEETEIGQHTCRTVVNAAVINSNHGPKENVAEDKTAAAPNAKKSTQFAANQALVSNVLFVGGRKTLLTRPNTAYMDQAKFELMKTVEVQLDEESPSRPEADESVTTSSDLSKVTSGIDKDVKKQSADASLDELLAAADVIKSIAQEEESRDVFQKPDEEQLKKKPERPTKPARPTLSDGDVGGSVSKRENGSKAAVEELATATRKEEHATVSSQPSNHHESVGDVGTLPKSSNKSKMSQDASSSGHHQTAGNGVRPPKPPPPVAGGLRLPSSSNADENTYL